MRSIERLILAVKRRETPSAAALHDLAKRAQRLEVPAPRALYGPLRRLRELDLAARDVVLRTFVHQPMFRAACEACGPRLLLYGGFPYLYGDLRLRIGADCKIHGRTAFAAGKVLDAPTLEIGDSTNIGFGVVVSVSERVTLGSHVRVADGVFITDNPGHPLDADARRRGEPVTAESIRPVVIEDDVWIGSGAIVLPGVRIGRGTVVGAGAVVTRDLPPGMLAAGNPARVVRSLAPSEAHGHRTEAMS